jgi:type II secretory pathway predicted ATPase ExeA
MYEQFYNLKKPPFANIPDPGFLYLSPQHKRALSILTYAMMTRAGFCVVTGDVGSGKTVLVRKLLQEIDLDVEVGLVSNTRCESFEEFLRWVMLAFDLEYRNKTKVEMYDELVRFMLESNRDGRPVTLIVDEAQHLSADFLEELRMLSNINTEKGQILQTILVGQPELWALLRRPELSQFAQRISYDYFLSPLESPEIVGEYITHRVTEAGRKEQLFLPETYQLIFEATSGIPRLINLVCDSALVYGYAEDANTIGTYIIKNVLADKEKGFFPVANRRNTVVEKPDFETKEKLVQSDIKRGANRKTSLSTIEKAAARLRKDG